MSYDFNGVYRPCTVCSAAIVMPFPPFWDLEMVKEGPPGGPVKTYLIPHSTGCTAPVSEPKPGVAVVVKGEYVKNLAVGLP